MRDCFKSICGFKAILMAFVMLIPIMSCRPEPINQEVPVLKASEKSLPFAGEGGIKTVMIEASGAWIAKADAPWVTTYPENAAGNKTVTVQAAKNPNDSKRTGKIEFSLTAYPDVKVEVNLVQAEKGASEPEPDPEDPENPENPEDDGPDTSTVVIPREDFTEETTWSVTGSIMNLGWTKDLPMLEEPSYGWTAAFDVVVEEGGEFKFRKDGDWAVNLGATNRSLELDKRYKLADDGANFSLPAGTYDLYIQPTFMLLYALEAGATFTHGDAVAEAEKGENVRIYVLNNSTWSKPYMYAYVGSGELQPYGAWPGTYAAGTKQFGDYTWTYWEASGFSGINGINLILSNNGADQYPAPDTTDELWSNLTILNTLFFVWDGTTLTQVEDPANPGVTGKGKEPDVVKFGSSSWTLIGTLEGTNWDTDFPMDTEGYWEVAREVTVASGEMFKFRQNRSWGSNLGYGEYLEEGAREAAIGSKLDMAADGANISLAPGTYDIYLAAENRIAYILTAGSAWTHEAEGKPEYGGEGDYDPNLSPDKKLSGITYQINIFSFKDSNGDGYGDLNGITESLDYFDKLGVTGLWLSPIHPAQSYHGYDVKDYTAIEKRYGTEEDFQNLINKAHEHNIRIYMDYVINHAGDQSVWFSDVREKGTKSEYWDYFSLSCLC